MNEKKNQPTSQDMDTVRFISLVSMFASSAYMSMGKIADPATGKAERDLDAARGFIDILIMLKAKTAGNLAKDEERMISSAISDLQLNFVREKEKPEPEPEAAGKKEEEEKEKSAAAGEKKEAPAPEEKPAEKAGGEQREAGTGPIITPPPEAEDEKKAES